MVLKLLKIFPTKKKDTINIPVRFVKYKSKKINNNTITGKLYIESDSVVRYIKGLKEKTVIIRHAVRNSLIPLATGIGGLIGVFLAGSYLIEKVFAIDGIGLLSFKAIGSRDYGIIMGFLVIGTIIRLFGNLISDLCYAAIDPRIRFK